MFQNSGLGNAVSPLTSLTHTFRIPVLLIVTWRGEPGGAADEPQHELMGEITPAMLETDADSLGVVSVDGRRRSRRRSTWRSRTLRNEGRPFALVMQKGSVADAHARSGVRAVRAPARRLRRVPRPRATHTRRDMLAAMQAAATDATC